MKDPRERRGLERALKLSVLALVKSSRETLPEIARALKLCPATVRSWRRAWSRHRLCIKDRGRPRKVMSPQTLQYLASISDEPYSQISVAQLHRHCPDASRRALQEWRNQLKKRQQQEQHRLEWRGVGQIWAMDFTHAPQPIDAQYPYALAVRDMASGYNLLALPCEHMRDEQVTAALRPLFVQHGAPLVLKHDGGFKGLQIQELLNAWQVTALLSPPHTPRYNGSIEAGIGALKTRTHHLAAGMGRPEYWTCDDLEAARLQGNQNPNRSGLTPEDRWNQRNKITAEDRAGFTQLVRQLEANIESGWKRNMESEPTTQERTSARRLAVGRALEAHGSLYVHRRRLTPPLIAHLS